MIHLLSFSNHIFLLLKRCVWVGEEEEDSGHTSAIFSLSDSRPQNVVCLFLLGKDEKPSRDEKRGGKKLFFFSFFPWKKNPINFECLKGRERNRSKTSKCSKNWSGRFSCLLKRKRKNVFFFHFHIPGR